MIKVRVKEVCLERGIKTAYQLEKLLGFGPSMTARIFRGEWTRIDLKTLNALCSALDCLPNDLLCFEADAEEDLFI